MQVVLSVLLATIVVLGVHFGVKTYRDYFLLLFPALALF